jgi:putative redox protein
MTTQPQGSPTTQANGESDSAAPPSAAGPKPVVTTIRAVWSGDQRFEAGKPNGPAAVVDGRAKAGPGPVETRSAVDVIDIIAKRRTPVQRFEVDVIGHRRSEPPRRIMRLEMEFRIDGEGIEREHAERAIQLSFERYCSVAASLAPDIVTETRLILNGTSFPPVRQQVFTPT